MTKRATAADVLLRAAQRAQVCGGGYYGLIFNSMMWLKAPYDAFDAAENAATFLDDGDIEFQSRRIRVLALLFARELVLQGDV